MGDSVGVGKGTVTFDDLEESDAIFVIGQIPEPTTRACLSRCARR